jgi:ADP-ribose pyrophosphatase YjhB (NUDIX family)
MIRFDEGTRRFNYRVVGVAIYDGSVLLHRADHESFWTLPGGRAEHGETAEQTVKREMQEELQTDVDVVRLLWFVENFFEYDGCSYHEIALYFLIRFPDNSLPATSAAFDRTDGGVLLRFQWHPVEAALLTQLPLVPAFLPAALTDLPSAVVHIVQRATVPTATCPPQ